MEPFLLKKLGLEVCLAKTNWLLGKCGGAAAANAHIWQACESVSHCLPSMELGRVRPGQKRLSDISLSEVMLVLLEN